jgi:hypothetical protein
MCEIHEANAGDKRSMYESLESSVHKCKTFLLFAIDHCHCTRRNYEKLLVVFGGKASCENPPFAFQSCKCCLGQTYRQSSRRHRSVYIVLTDNANQ